MNALGKHMDGLMREIEAYLGFWDVVAVGADDEHLWREYIAWKRISDDRSKTLRERIAAYGQRRT